MSGPLLLCRIYGGLAVAGVLVGQYGLAALSLIVALLCAYWHSLRR